MKKCFVALLMVFVLSFALVGKANAIEPRMNSLDPDLTIEGTTAYCTFSASALGKEISATMNLWNGSTLVGSWSGTEYSSLQLEGSCRVESGKVYVLYVSGTIGGESFFTQPVTVRCP